MMKVIIDNFCSPPTSRSSCLFQQVLDYCILLGLIVAHSDYVEWGLYKGRELIDALTVLLRDESAECTSSASDQQSLRSVQLILSRLRDLMKI